MNFDNYNKQIISNEDELEILNILNNFNWKYYLTIHFTPKYDVNNPYKELDKIIRILQKKINGKNCYRKNRLTKIISIKEQKLSRNPHYHILIEPASHLTFSKLAQSIINITNLNQFKNVLEPINNHLKDYFQIITNYYNKPEKQEQNKHNINVVEIKSKIDKFKIINYITKDIYKNEHTQNITFH